MKPLDIKQVGSYQILRLLGEGGSGKVYLAEKERKQYAVKICQENVAKDDLFQLLFYREFSLLKRYRHPLIVCVEDFGWDDTNQCLFFSSEFVDGKNLKEFFVQASTEEIIHAIFQILRAMSFLHRHGIKHRDIKPENILVQNHEIKLIDFGFAGLEKNILAGTLPYMAPEILDGQSYQNSCDMYSLGVTLHECFFGMSPKIPSALLLITAALMDPNQAQRPTAQMAISLLLPLLTDKQALQDIQKDVLIYLAAPPFIDDNHYLQKVEEVFKKSRFVLFEIKAESGLGATRFLQEIETLAQLNHFAIAKELKDPWECQNKAHVFLFNEPIGESNILDWINQYQLLLPLGSRKHFLFGVNFSEVMTQDAFIIKLEPWTDKNIKTILAGILSYKPDQLNVDSLLKKTKGNPALVLSLLQHVIKEEVNVLFDANLLSHKISKIIKNDLDKKLKHTNPIDKKNPAPESLESLGLIQLRLGNYRQAEDFFYQVRDHSESLEQKIRAENYLAQVYWQTGRLDEAQKIFLKNWQDFEQQLNEVEKARVTNFNLTGLYLDLKECQKCLEQVQKEISVYQKLNKPETVSRLFYDAGEAHYQLKDFVKARNQWLRGLELALQSVNQELLLRFYNALGNLCTRQKQYDEALQHYDKSLYYAYTQHDPAAMCQILYNQALIKKQQGFKDQCRSHLETARQYLENIKNDSVRNSFTKVLLEFKVGTEKQSPSQSQRFSNFYAKGDFMQNDNQLPAVYRSLLHISELLSSERNPGTLMTLVLRYAIQLSGAERGAILLSEENQLSVACTQNADKEEVLGQISLQIANQVLSTGDIIQSHDATHDERFSDNRSVILFHLKSIFCLPIRALGRTVGVIYLDHQQSAQAFSDFDKEVLVAYCQQVGTAIENARLFDFYQKQTNELSQKLDQSEEEKRQVLKELKSEKQDWMGKYTFEKLITQSAPMFRVFETLEPIIETNLAILIQGESGTGKEILAKSVHFQSLVKKGPFITANCGAIPENLLESELFGYKAGAFTGATKDKKGLFEAANGGTLFLDEVGELSLSAQVKLLRVLQEGEIVPVGDTVAKKIKVRLLSATHKNLQILISRGDFREDLYYRISEFQIDLPPLRNRIEDIPMLVESFVQEYCKEHSIKKKISVATDMIRRLMDYHWPGNIRELHNTIRVGCALSKKSVMQVDSFPNSYSFLHGIESMKVVAEKINVSNVESHDQNMIYDVHKKLEDYEKIIYAKAYEYYGFKAKKTYESLGVSNVTFFNKIKKWDLKDKDNLVYKEKFNYRPELNLKEHLVKAVNAADQHFEGHSYQVIEALGISPGYFYKLKQKCPVRFETVVSG